MAYSSHVGMGSNLYNVSALSALKSAVLNQPVNCGLAARRQSKGHRRSVRKWAIERLENWVVPSTIMVMNIDDSGAGSLRAAIQQADVEAAQDTITFASSVTGTISLSTA